MKIEIYRNLKNVEMTYHSYGNNTIETHDVKELVLTPSWTSNNIYTFSVLETPQYTPTNWLKTYDFSLQQIEKIRKEYKPIETKDLPLPNNWFRFKDNSFGLKDNQKYGSCLLIINPDLPTLPFKKIDYKEFNLTNGDLEYIIGDYFVTKKNISAFKINPDGKHYLLRDNWGGSFSKYFGNELAKLNTLYYRRSRSNGGGSGYDYAVINIDTKYCPNIDDI